MLHLGVSFSNLQINMLTTYMDVNFNKRLQTLISVVYTIFVYITHPINRISKVGAATCIVNTISSYKLQNVVQIL